MANDDPPRPDAGSTSAEEESQREPAIGDPDAGLTLPLGAERSPAADPPTAESAPEHVERLAGSDSRGRYVLEGEVGRGGMGAVLRVYDGDLRRRLAMKVLLGQSAGGVAGEAPSAGREQLSRFVEEAQVTGQLDHPGVVPVHELGVDSEGRIYFTMQLVKGRELLHVIQSVHADDGEWTLTRALNILLKVCETMAFAHDKGVIHRDLKPSNVMVGRYGEVYVMDWGLARVEGQEDRHDLRLRPAANMTISELVTDRQEERGSDVDSPVVTMDGTVVGTPYYMPPEQAAGRIEDLGAWSDVYSLGSMLYHLLGGRMPYHRPGERPSPHTVLAMVLAGAPTPLRELEPAVPHELEAICEKAMAREPGQRYADMHGLADDLRAFLEGRVVQAFQTGPIAELKKWVGRNKGLAASLAAAVGLLVVGSVVVSILYVDAKNARDLADQHAAMERHQSYVANMRAVTLTTDSGEIPAAHRHLKACPEELRNWEWHHFRLATESSIAVIEGREDRASLEPHLRLLGTNDEYDSMAIHLDVPNIGFDVDAGRILLGSWDPSLMACDIRTGELLEVLEPAWGVPSGTRTDVAVTAFTPRGLRLVTRSLRGAAQLWTEGGDVLALNGHKRPVETLAFDPGGARIASGSWDSTVCIWDAENGELLQKGETKWMHDGRRVQPRVRSVAFSPDGERLAAGANDHRLRLWNTRDLEEPIAVRNHAGAVFDVAFSPDPDESRIATASFDRSVGLWDGKTAEPLGLLRGHQGAVFAVAFSPDGSLLATGARDRTVRIWDVDTQSELAVLQGHEEGVLAVAFSPDGTRIVSRSLDWRVWDTATGTAIAELVGPAVSSVAFSADGSRMASAHEDGTVRLRDGVTGEPLGTLRGHEVAVTSVAFEWAGSRLVSGARDGTVRLWDLEQEPEPEPVALDGHEPGNPVVSLAFSPDGTRVVSGSWDKTARVWDVGSRETLHVLELGARVQAVAVDASGTRMAAGLNNHLVELRDMASGELVQTFEGHTDLVLSVAFSPDGTRLASASWDMMLRLWDCASGEQEERLEGHTGKVVSVAFSPDGTRIVSASKDRSLILWEGASGELLHTLTGADAPLTTVAFSPDGKRIVSGSASGQLRLLHSDLEQARAMWAYQDSERRAR